MVKNIFSTVKNFGENSVFSGEAQSCSKILNGKKYIYYRVKISGQTLFLRESVSRSKILNGEKICNRPTMYSGYIHLGVIHVILG